MNRKLITIYVVCTNHGQFISDCLNSLANQKKKNFDLVIINNGSTDNSNEIINKFKFKDVILLEFKQTFTLHKIANLMIKKTNTDFIMRLDGDDILEKNATKIFENYISKNKSSVAFFGNYYLINQYGKKLGKFIRHNFKKVKLLDQPAHGACTLFNKNFLSTIGGYESKFKAQDGFLIWLKLIESKKKFTHIKEPIFFYRQHPYNLTKNTNIINSSKFKILKLILQKNLNKISSTCFIPLLDREINNKFFSQFKIENKKLIDLKIDELLKCKFIKKIIVSTDNELIKSYISKKKKYKNIKVILRSESDKNKQPIELARKIFSKQKEKYVAFSQITNPFLDHKSISIMFMLIYFYKADKIIPTVKSPFNFYKHNGNTLKNVNKVSDFILEREQLFREIAQFRIFNKNSLKSNKINKITHFEIDKKSSFVIRDIQDIKIANFINKLNI